MDKYGTLYKKELVVCGKALIKRRKTDKLSLDMGKVL